MSVMTAIESSSGTAPRSGVLRLKAALRPFRLKTSSTTRRTSCAMFNLSFPRGNLLTPMARGTEVPWLAQTSFFHLLFLNHDSLSRNFYD